MRQALLAAALGLALPVSLAACGPSGGSGEEAGEASAPSAPAVSAGEMQAETARLNTWLDEKYEEQVAFSPIQLSFLGRKQRNDEIDCMTRECMDEQLAFLSDSVEELRAEIDYDKLTPEGKTSYDLWIYQSDVAQRSAEFRDQDFTFDQMSGLQSFAATFLINFHDVSEAADLTAYLSRIEETGRALEEAVANAQTARERGVVPPRFALEGVIAQSRGVIEGAPFTDGGEDAAVFADFKREAEELVESGELSREAADDLVNEARDALTGPFLEGYQAIIAYAEDAMSEAPGPEDAVGAASLPDGAAFYEERLANQTTTDLSAEEIHQLGLEEVDRLRAAMEEVKDEAGFDGTLQEFFNDLRDDKDNPRYYYPDTDEGRQAYIDDATAAIDTIKAQLPAYFGILPKADLVVKRVEAFREQDGAAQHYYPGTPDGSRPGIYYAHLSDMKAMPKRELEVIAYHEGLPGHHMQISIAQELEDLPRFRTQYSPTAYVEGWALYSEALAAEMPGTFEDPLSEFGRLGSEIWRAIRLVVDTGLHSKGWSEERAVEYFMANSAITEAQARAEVQRYIVLPGQATSYKVGMIKIQQLRAEAEAELGDAFDIRDFHDVILGGGAMPLDLLERQVDQYIEDAKA